MKSYMNHVKRVCHLTGTCGLLSTWQSWRGSVWSGDTWQVVSTHHWQHLFFGFWLGWSADDMILQVLSRSVSGYSGKLFVQIIQIRSVWNLLFTVFCFLQSFIHFCLFSSLVPFIYCTAFAGRTLQTNRPVMTPETSKGAGKACVCSFRGLAKLAMDLSLTTLIRCVWSGWVASCWHVIKS